MNKPLKDWTLGEIKTECVKRNAFCKANGKCPFFALQDKGSYCKIEDKVGGAVPSYWDLSEPPRWTEQDREDAKMIKRVFNGVQTGVARDNLAQLRTIAKVGFPSEYINSDMFPLLNPGESATLDEIIGGAE